MGNVPDTSSLPSQLLKKLQAVGVLLKEEDAQQTNYMRLLKLLYIADREALKETGRTISGDPILAMERGPVLTKILGLIKGTAKQSGEWAQFIRTKHYHINLVFDPGVSKMSRFEVAKLKEVSHRYCDKDEWEMVLITHELPEWKKNDPGKSSKPIPFEDLVEAVGLSGHEEELSKVFKQQKALAALFGD